MKAIGLPSAKMNKENSRKIKIFTPNGFSLYANENKQKLRQTKERNCIFIFVWGFGRKLF